MHGLLPLTNFVSTIWGRIKIRYALRIERISDSCIDEALADIPEADYRAVLADFLTAKERTTKRPKPTTSVTKNWCALRLTADSNLKLCVSRISQRRADAWQMDEVDDLDSMDE